MSETSIPPLHDGCCYLLRTVAVYVMIAVDLCGREISNRFQSQMHVLIEVRLTAFAARAGRFNQEYWTRQSATQIDALLFAHVQQLPLAVRASIVRERPPTIGQFLHMSLYYVASSFSRLRKPRMRHRMNHCLFKRCKLARRA